MRAFRLDEFTSREGDVFDLLLGDKTLPLSLARVRTLPDTGREGGAFVLDWEGPYEPVLPQDIYTLRHGDETFEMFIVPVAQSRDGTKYEAVFN
ncbi:MAG TPA: hypothetical protein VF718_07910 [Allosphingosinicella sp.]|jgi:hypothetical protein